MAVSEKILKTIKEAKSLEELKGLAENYKVHISDEKIEQIFNQYHTSCELTDEQLENVSGGCDTRVTDWGGCNNWVWNVDKRSRPAEYSRDPHSYYEPISCKNCIHSYWMDQPCSTELYCPLV